MQIVDIRQAKHIADGVIPGALWMPFAEWRGTEDRPSQPPTEEEFEALLGAHGLNIDDPIVVHHRAGKTIQTGRAAIVYWLLKSAGADQVAILDGGYAAWTDAGLPSDPTPSQQLPRVVDVTFNSEWWADAMDIFAVTSGQVNGAILDARLDAQVRKSVETGKPMMSMPMAQFVPASLFTSPMSSRRISEEGQRAFLADLAARGITEDAEFLISVCQTGELSALSWFYASEIIGIENVRYYPDALRGWAADGGLMFGLQVQE
ncbi:MAG: rhodanese-like domain-containing protein [Pseudomonadota bacterium]